MSISSALAACILLVPALTVPVAAQECTSFPLIAELGAGTPGSSGVPELHTLGQPMVDQPGMGLRLTGGAPAAAAQIIVGSPVAPQFLPAYGARLYPGSSFTRFPVTLGADGSSPAVLSGPAATSPALCGLEFVVQGVVSDPAAQGGLAFTSGLRLRFGVGSAAASLFPGAKFHVPPPSVPCNVVSMTAGDLNGDGRIDLAVGLDGTPYTNEDAGVRVMLQLPDGTLWPGSYFDTGPGYPNQILLLDIDGDVVLDLVVLAVPYQPGTGPPWIAIGLGLGDGTFEVQPVLSGPATKPKAIAAADLDGDGLPELAVGPWTAQGGCAVFPNLGLGLFGTPVELPPMGDIESQSLRFADMDGDGRLDLLGLVPFQHLGVHYGLGGTAFGPAVLSDLGTEYCFTLAVDDLDADGDVDLVVADHGTPGGPDPSLRVYWNTGAGQLSAPAVLDSSPFFFDTASTADLDGDGLPEILSTHTFQAYVVPNLGGGAFGPAQLSKVHATQTFPVDMDGDGQIDLAVRGSTWARWIAGAGDGSFVLPPPLPNPAPSEGVCVDVDLDGHLDVAGVISGGALQVLLGAGDGTFGSPIESIAAATPLQSVDVGLVDGDSLPDAVVTHNSDGPSNWTITVLLGQGGGHFATTGQIALPNANDARLVDLDADGSLDVLAFSWPGNGQLHALLGAGDGTFGAPLLAASSIRSFDLGDVNEDGFPDVVGFDEDEAVVLRLGVGNGTFAAEMVVSAGPVSLGTPTLRMADLDLDGHLDLVHTGWSFETGALLHTYRGDGAGTFAPVQTTAGLDTLGPLAIADVNGDGAPDIVASGVQLGFGDCRFAVPQWGEVGGPLGDVDEDGDLDAVFGLVYLNSLY